MIKTVGICLLLFALIYLVKRLSSSQRRRVDVLREICALLRHIRRQVGCYLLPAREIARSYSSDLLEACGFLDMMRSGENPILSFSGEYCISERPMQLVNGVLSSFGEGYVEDEIRALDVAIDELSALLATEEAECAKRIKLYSVLGAAIGVGALIFIL